MGQLDKKQVSIGIVEIQETTKLKTQKLLDRYGLGVQVIDVNLQSVEPPSAVIETFNSVSSAKIDRQRLINEALGRKSAVLPKARGVAAQTLEDAKSYGEEKTNRARGESENFVQQMAAYQGAEEITQTRLYLEAVEKALADVEKFIKPPRGTARSVELWFQDEGNSKDGAYIMPGLRSNKR
ncbi:MAG: hypothetical protein GY866_31660 [Proteobacteria bacterium]|nr:hypothetical protein [Pseudomonadota bacterium]